MPLPTSPVPSRSPRQTGAAAGRLSAYMYMFMYMFMYKSCTGSCCVNTAFALNVMSVFQIKIENAENPEFSSALVPDYCTVLDTGVGSYIGGCGSGPVHTNNK